MHTRNRLSRPARRCVPLPFRPQLEPLEARCVLYSASGNAWPNPELITISFVPDGTNLGGVSSNLFSTFNARFGSAAAWQNKILQAFQLWAQQTNVNFALTADDGTASGGGSFQQGDPGFGDIRIGGYNIGGNYLGIAYFPPEGNNYSIAGDFALNTGKAYNINGTDFDLFSVAVHEIGHSLGLEHSSSTGAVMYATYNGVDTALKSDDVAGIRSIYGGARAKDSYDATASNDTFATASNITSAISTTAKNALIANLDVTTTADVDYYKFTVPAGMAVALAVKVQSSGLSLLTPTFKIYNSGQAQVGATVTGSGFAGGTVQTSVSVTAGATYYIRVDGKDATANGTGRYALSLSFAGGTAPSVTSPDTQTENGNQLSGSGGIANSQGGVGSFLGNLVGGVVDVVVGLLGGLLGAVERFDYFEVDPEYQPYFGPPAGEVTPAAKEGCHPDVVFASPDATGWTRVSLTASEPSGRPSSARDNRPNRDPSFDRDVRLGGYHDTSVGNTLLGVPAPRKKSGWWNDEVGQDLPV